MEQGKIIQIMCAVVDVRLPQERGPKIQEALTVVVEDHTRVMEVAQQLGEGVVRCIMMDTSEGLSKGLEVTATGAGITVPVGEKVLGRMFNLLGEPIDGG